MLLNQNNSHSIQKWIGDLITIAILVGVFYALWMGSYALFTPDEGRYSEVAREMVATNDYITPRLNGVVFLDKPIFYYWLQASAIKLFGIKEWALRLWPMLFGIIGCLMTYIAGHLLFNRRTGFISAIILATSPLYYGAAHYANLDLEVAVLISLTLMSFIVAVRVTRENLRNYFLIAAYAFAGLAALTKGLIGIVFPAMIIGAWILLLNRWSFLKKMHLIKGLLFFIAIALPWYILVQKANPEFFEFFFIKQQVSRFLTTDYFNNRTPTWFYIPIVIAGFFPWCVFGLQALTCHIKNVIRNRQQHASEFYLLLWFILVFTFFSIPKSKTIGYILPIFPALALLIGNYISTSWEKSKSIGIYFGIISFILSSLGILIFCLAAPYFPELEISPPLIPYLNKVAILFAAATVIFIFLALQKKKLSTFFFTLLTISIAFLLIFNSSSATLNEGTAKPIALELKSVLKPEDEVITYFKYYQDLPIYLERRITIVADWEAKDIPLRDNWVRELWYGMPFQDTKQWLINEDTFWQRWHSTKRVFVITNTNYLAQFNRKAKNSFYKIGQFNQILLLSNKA